MFLCGYYHFHLNQITMNFGTSYIVSELFSSFCEMSILGSAK